MSRGELAVYTIKSDYAYGSTGSPPKIPGGATLIFEIEVRFVKPVPKFVYIIFITATKGPHVVSCLLPNKSITLLGNLKSHNPAI